MGVKGPSQNIVGIVKFRHTGGDQASAPQLEFWGVMGVGIYGSVWRIL